MRDAGACLVVNGWKLLLVIAAAIAALSSGSAAAKQAPRDRPGNAYYLATLRQWFRTDWWQGASCLQLAPPLVYAGTSREHYPWSPRRSEFGSVRADALVDAGLLSRQRKAYRPTAMGRKYLARPGGLSFCWGRISVTRIVSVGHPELKPAAHTFTVRVKYLYRVVDIPSWVRTAAVKKRYQLVDEALKGQEHECEAVFSYDSGAWQVDARETSPCTA